MDVKYTMATIRRRRRPLMGRGMHIVQRPRRQRGGRMHNMRPRFQKGKGVIDPNERSGIDFPLLAELFGAGWLAQKFADSKRKKYKD